MNPLSAPLGKIRVALITLAVSGVLSPATVRAQVPAPVPEAKPEFTPEIEKKFAEFLAKAGGAKCASLETRMTKEVEAISKATALSAEGVKALEAAAKLAAAASAKDWSNKLEVMFRRESGRIPQNLSEVFDEIIPQAESYAEMEIIRDYRRPFEDAAWTGALGTTLTAEQAGVWSKAQAERRHAIEGQVASFIKPQVEEMRETHLRLLELKAAGIKSALALSTERITQLDQLVKAAATKSAEAARKDIEKSLFSVTDEQLREILAGKEQFGGMETEPPADEQPFWKEGLKAFLTAAEWSELEKLKQLHQQRREQAMATLMIVEFDQRVGLSALQRQQLEAVCGRLIKADPASFSKETEEGYNQVSSEQFLAAGAKTTAGEMQQILDPNQWKRWQEACKQTAAVQRPARGVEEPPASKPRAFEPEELERIVSDFLFERTSRERQRILALQLLKVEEVARIAQLDAAVITQLQTAARGATEEYLSPWKATLGQAVRAQLRDVTPQTLQERLAGMGDPNQGRRSFLRESDAKASEKLSLWDKAVQCGLNDAQRAVWQKEAEARKEFNQRAVEAVILAELDRITRLSTAQWEELAPLIGTIIADYAPEFASMFNSNVAWYFQGHILFVPLAGIPEAKLKAVLGKEAWERFTGCDQFSNSKSYWESLESLHAQRLKAKKQ